MRKNHYYCIIMAGGLGRRFWPYSRTELPKQFLDFFGCGQTLLRQTYDRYKKIIPLENIYITTHHDYVNLVKEILPEFNPEQIIVEEARRNTAPSLAYASHVISKKDENATVVIAPSDHLILNQDEFEKSILEGLDFAASSRNLVNVAIKPTRPDTGYGYIQVDDEGREGNFYKVKTFIEKPALEFAEVFVQSNEFYWNSGIFIWHIKTIMEAFHKNLSEICPKIDSDSPDFTSCPNASIDTSIMEKSDNVYVQVCHFGWADLGTWESLYHASPKDKDQNVIVNSDTLLYNCKNNIVLMPKDKLVVIDGLEDYLIAEHEDALLICKKDNQNAIRKYVNDIEMKFGGKYI